MLNAFVFLNCDVGTEPTILNGGNRRVWRAIFGIYERKY